MDKAATATRDSLRLPVRPNKLLNLASENSVARTLAANTEATAASTEFGRHEKRPETTTCKSHNINTAPDKPVRRMCLLNSKTLVVHGKKKTGTKKTPANI